MKAEIKEYATQNYPTTTQTRTQIEPISYTEVSPSIGRGLSQTGLFAVYWTGVGLGGLVVLGLRAVTWGLKKGLGLGAIAFEYADTWTAIIQDKYEETLMAGTRPKLPTGRPDPGTQYTHIEPGQSSKNINIVNQSGGIININ